MKHTNDDLWLSFFGNNEACPYPAKRRHGASKVPLCTVLFGFSKYRNTSNEFTSIDHLDALL